MLKKITFRQNKRFCFRQLQLITGLLLICNSYRSWSTRFISLELCVGFYIFDSVSFVLKFTFLFSKKHGLFDFKTLIPFKLKILEKPHGVLLQNLWLLSCSKKFENSTISAWVGTPQVLLSSPELELPKNWFGAPQVRHFFSIVTFKQIFDIPLLKTYLFISITYFFDWTKEYLLKESIKRTQVWI